ncbi:hypothetical protein TCAL_15772 [Tigriopus californicus]|uniref:Uncharacterized protein n=1 Tax=Tigriopus californicus TaxID=6832 RepID=A0A553P6B5_TIGCA|nr:hypothetical protein TCAL_15772 [Tigriopus californicus]
MYLYIGSIVAIMCIYITVLLDNCPSLTRSNKADQVQNSKGKIDPETGSVASFGTLRRAHIDRKKIAMHATMESTCVDDILIAHPFSKPFSLSSKCIFFCQLSGHRLRDLGLFARFGFITSWQPNLCLWIRTIIWESATEWIHTFIETTSRMLCAHGRWRSCLLVPRRYEKLLWLFGPPSRRRATGRVDCKAPAKAFSGPLCVWLGGIIILIILLCDEFVLLRPNSTKISAKSSRVFRFFLLRLAKFSEEMFWIFVWHGNPILGLAILGCGGFVQMQ